MSLTNSLTEQKQKEAEAAAEAARNQRQGRHPDADRQGIRRTPAQGLTLPKLPMMLVHPLYGHVASLSFSRDSNHFPHTGLAAKHVRQLLESVRRRRPALPRALGRAGWRSSFATNSGRSRKAR